MRRYVMIKQSADLQSSSIAQREIALYLQTYNIDEHIAKIVAVYKERRDVMLAAMVEHFPLGIKYTTPAGGLFTWLELRADMDAAEILKLALQEKVAFVPGAAFFPNGGKRNYLRLNYSNMPIARIQEGVKQLGKVLHRVYEQ
jgi:2-aminoadipate transaminase